MITGSNQPDTDEKSEKVDTSSAKPAENMHVLDDGDEYAATAVEATIVPDDRIYASSIEPYPGDNQFIEGVPVRAEIPTQPLKEVSCLKLMLH